MKVVYEKNAFKMERAHPTDAGLDIRAMYDGVVKAGQSATFHTGIHVALPHETMGDIRPKSGLMFKHDLLTFGTVDQPYTGEIMIHMFNLGKTDYNVKRGDKIAQMSVTKIVYEPLEEVDELSESDRGSAGFGSTGR